MLPNKLSKYLLLAVLILMAVGIYVYREYNRKAPDTSDLAAAYELTGIELIQAFQNGEADANSRYLGKVLVVSGVIKSVDSDSAGTQTLVLGDTASMSSVRCIMEKTSEVASYAVGKTIAVKGICTGYNADDMGLGADVILNRCISQNSVKP